LLHALFITTTHAAHWVVVFSFSCFFAQFLREAHSLINAVDLVFISLSTHIPLEAPCSSSQPTAVPSWLEASWLLQIWTSAMPVSQVRIGYTTRKYLTDLRIAASIRSVASTLAYGTMSYYTGNITNTTDVSDPGGDFSIYLK